MEHVRERSGASIGSIYHHFAGKEQLAAALYVEGLRRYQEGAAAALRRHPGAEEGVRALVRHHLRWVRSNPELARFLLGRREAEVVRASEAELREMNRGFFAEVNGWLERHIEAGRLRRLPFDLFYALLIGPSQEWSRHHLAGRTETSPASVERELAGAAWRAVGIPDQEEP
jgi:AcrR family transcriptional regulator